MNNTKDKINSGVKESQSAKEMRPANESGSAKETQSAKDARPVKESQSAKETRTANRTVTIDATNRRLGRLASEIANILNGKDSASYRPNVAPNVTVSVSNASRMHITEKKRKTKVYDRYTGYFGGRRTVTLAQMIEKKGYGEPLRKAVYGMLPHNRLRAIKMKRLQIQE